MIIILSIPVYGGAPREEFPKYMLMRTIMNFFKYNEL